MPLVTVTRPIDEPKRAGAGWLVEAVFDVQPTSCTLTRLTYRRPARPSAMNSRWAPAAHPDLVEDMRRAAIKQGPRIVRAATHILARERHRRGRAPRLPLLARLRLLQDVEGAASRGEPVSAVAHRHGVTTTYLRDLLLWAQTDFGGLQLFRPPGPGQAPGLTDIAWHLLAQLTAAQDPVSPAGAS